MKKFTAGMVAGLMMGAALTFASASLDHNGTFWGSLDHSAKTGYVNGYADAMTVSAGKLDNLMVAAELFHWRGAKKIIHQVARELSLNEIKPEDVVKRLDELYSNRKYSDLDVGSALQLLVVRSGDAQAQAPAASPPPAK